MLATGPRRITVLRSVFYTGAIISFTFLIIPVVLWHHLAMWVIWPAGVIVAGTPPIVVTVLLYLHYLCLPAAQEQPVENSGREPREVTMLLPAVFSGIASYVLALVYFFKFTSKHPNIVAKVNYLVAIPVSFVFLCYICMFYRHVAYCLTCCAHDAPRAATGSAIGSATGSPTGSATGSATGSPPGSSPEAV